MKFIKDLPRSSEARGPRRFALTAIAALCALSAAPSAWADRLTVTSVADASATQGKPGSTTDMAFVISRSGDDDFDEIVTYTTVDGTAVAGEDYVATTGSVTLASGEDSAIVEVPIMGARAKDRETGLTFSLELTKTKAKVNGTKVKFQNYVGTDLDNVYPAWQKTADFNQDGRVDVAVVFSSSSHIELMRNDSTEGAPTVTLTPAGDVSTVYGVGKIAVGDLNNDGMPDIVGSSQNENKVNILLNTSTAGSSDLSFSSTIMTTVDYGWSDDAAIADFNMDGQPDFALANPGTAEGTNRVLVYLNHTADGATTPDVTLAAEPMTSANSYTFPIRLAVADFNGDGKPDIAVGNRDGDGVGVLINKTEPGSDTVVFKPVVNFPDVTGNQDLVAVDLNGDGKPDIAGPYGALINNMSQGGMKAKFITADMPFADQPSGISAGDLDGDGKADIVIPDVDVGNTLYGGIRMFLNRTPVGSTSLTWKTNGVVVMGDQPEDISIEDYNQDGAPDLAVTDTSIQALNVLAGMGDIELKDGTTTATGTINP